MLSHSPLLLPLTYVALLDTAVLSIFIPEIKRCDSAFGEILGPVVGEREGGEHFLAHPSVKPGSSPWGHSWAWSFLSQGLISHLTVSDKLVALKRGI